MEFAEASAAWQHALEQRQERIAARLPELSARRPGQAEGTSAERAELALRHLRNARLSFYQALVSCHQALLNSAQAHDRVASTHERAADAGFGSLARHQQDIAFHRAAAEVDRNRAERVAADIDEARRVIAHDQDG